MSKRKLVL